jgi:hypothetical protein
LKLPVTRRFAIILGGAVAAAVALFASCGGCGRSNPSSPSASASASSSATDGGGRAAPSVAIASDRLWELAKDGEEEDLATLAVHEGAAGLVEGAARADQRMTAIKAMAYARGWAQLPFLANAALAKDEAEAKAALDSVVDLAARPRTSEDLEDKPELEEGCAKLVDLAKAADRDKPRRVTAIRALRMMPCPKADLPTDLDAK